MRRLIIAGSLVLLALPLTSIAQPSVPPGYTVELVASGALAADGITIHDGYVYVTDYIGGALLRVPVSTTDGSFEGVAAGIVSPTDVAVTPDGRIFVTASSFGQLIEVANGTWTVLAPGFDTCTSIEVIAGDLFITNSTPGTITRTDPVTLETTIVLSGLEYAWGVTSDGTDAIYFLEHGQGNIWQSSVTGASPTLLATATGWGVHFAVAEPRKGKSKAPAVLYISDTLSNVIWRLDRGQLSVFAAGFSGKTNVPYIGPTGLALDRAGALYVADAGVLWRIVPLKRGRK